MADEYIDRRDKKQIIKRMLKLRLIENASEIDPTNELQKNVKKKNKKSKEQTNPSTKVSNQPKRNVVKTPLDLGTVRELIDNVDNDKYRPAFEWLQECLNDAIDDIEETSEEDDGVPLLPLQEICKEAMDNNEFQEVLLSLGIQPPISGMENYWRIPNYLNVADLEIRAQIVGLDRNIDPQEVHEYFENIKKKGLYNDIHSNNEESDPTNSLPSSDDDEEYVKEIQGKLKRLKNKRDIMSSSSEEEEEAKENSDDINMLFDKFKKTQETNDEDINFNSEEYRKRLLELENDEENDKDEYENEVNTNRRRLQIIDSDNSSDEQSLSLQKLDNEEEKHQQKRQRSPSKNVNKSFESDSNKEFQLDVASNGKRRRVAVITDDDD